MALATQCPFCQTIFRVAGDQLKLRGGLVRCGKCNEVFDGNTHLFPPAPGAWPTLPQNTPGNPQNTALSPPTITPSVARANAAAPNYGAPPQAEQPDAETLAEIEAAWNLPPLSDALAEEGGEVAPVEAEENVGADAADALMIEDQQTEDNWVQNGQADNDRIEDRHTDPLNPAIRPGLPLHPSAAAIDFDTNVLIGSDPDDDEGDAVHAVADTAATASDTGSRADRAGSYRDEEADNAARLAQSGDLRNHPFFTAGTLDAGNACDRSDTDAADNLGYQPVEADYMVHQLGFVRRAQRRERWRRTARVLLWLGCTVLLLAAVMQGIYLARNQIAATLPATRPLLIAACARLQCSVGLQRQIDLLSIESNELQATVPGEPALTLQLLLRNRSDVAQVWPHIELTLNDRDEKALIRRVFAPAEYLAAGNAQEKGMAPNSEHAVKLSFLLPEAIASGYRVYLFYP